MSLPILQGTFPSGDLYANAMSSAYLQDWRILDPDLSQQREPEIWEKIQRDGRIAQAIHQRCAGVAGGDWTIQPASEDQVDKQMAEIVREAFADIRQFREARKKLAHAIFRGRAYGYIEGSRRPAKLGDYPSREWWMPSKIRDIDKRRFQIVSDSTENEDGVREVAVHQEMWSVAQMKWIKIAPDELKALIAVIWGEEESNFHYYGMPLISSLYFLYWLKCQTLQQGMMALEKFAGGQILVSMSPENHPAAAGTDNETIRDAYIDELKKQRGEHIFVHPQGDEVSVLSGGAEGHQMIDGWLSYLDGAIMSTALGATLPFGVGEGVGSLARAEVEREVSEGFLQYDRELLDEHLTRTLVKMFVDLNWSNFVELGLESARTPKFVTTQQPREDPNAKVGVISQALSAGISLRKDEVYDALGFSPPDDSSPVFEGQEPGGGMGGMGGGGFPFTDDRGVKLRADQADKFG